MNNQHWRDTIIDAGFLVLLFLILLGAIYLSANQPRPRPVLPTDINLKALEQYHELQEIVRPDLADLKEDCPTCVTHLTQGFLVNPGGKMQDAAVVFVWYPGDQHLFVRGQRNDVNLVYIFLPSGLQDPALKLFLSHPPEVKP